MKNESQLIKVWEDFCREQKLPLVSADEISDGLTDYQPDEQPNEKQKEFAKSFCVIWDYFQNSGERGGYNE